MTRLGADQQAEVLRFPPAMSRTEFERSEYMKSFPQLAGSVHAFCGDEHQHQRVLQCLDRGDDWTESQKPTYVVMTPAACYPVSVVARAGALPADGRIVDVFSYCFRHEPSLDPTRMQLFRMREYVRIGTPEQIVSFRETWIERGTRMIEALRLPNAIDLANDPFFGRGGKIVANSQREQNLKFELLIPIEHDDRQTACLSFNYHMDHFGLLGTSAPRRATSRTRLRRLRPRTAHARAVPPSRLRHRGRRAKSATCCGARHEIRVPRRRASFDDVRHRARHYRPHPLHSQEMVWKQTNCYVDMWLEVLRWWGFNPYAALPFTIALDFEGDQFTFFKFPHDELERLYGIVVQEHSIYEPLDQHIETQVARGHLMIVEVDAWFLPDTRGSSYRTQHTKTTIGIDAIDRAKRQIGYFHNSGYYVAEDFDYNEPSAAARR